MAAGDRGAQTARGLEDVKMSGVQLLLYPDVIKAFAMVTLAAARASVDCGAVGTGLPDGIEHACREIIDGKQQSPLLLDVFQGGAGTALRVGMALGNRRLVAAMHDLIASFDAKGQEFTALGKMLAGDVRALEAVQYVLCEISAGATAIGTGLNAPIGYAQRCTARLADVSGLPLSLGSEPVEKTADPIVLYSSFLKSLAVTLSTVCHHLRLLASVPRSGRREIALPPNRPGSSTMPGTVNSTIPDAATMIPPAQLNVVEPAVAARIFEAQTLFINAVHALRRQCVDGISTTPDVCRHDAESTLVAVALATFPGSTGRTAPAAAPGSTGGDGSTNPDQRDWLFMQPWPKCRN